MLVDEIKVGDVLCMSFDFRVIGVDVSGNKTEVIVESVKDKTRFRLCGDDTFAEARSADFFTTTIHSSKTGICDILSNCSVNDVFTVNWTKANGSLRTIRAKLIDINHLGYIRVRSLDNNNEMRIIDTRTIHWIIINGKKYVVK